jgi:hypothetical protein
LGTSFYKSLFPELNLISLWSVNYPAHEEVYSEAE